MAQKDKATLTVLFEDGDTPSGSDFADLIDSQVNLQETTAQSMSGPLGVAGAIAATTTVSAADGEFGAIAVSGLSKLAAVSAVGDMTIMGDLVVTGQFTATVTEMGQINAAATAAVSASATFINAIVDATADPVFLVNFESSANTLVYKGAVSANFLATGIVSILASAGGTETELTIFVDGSADNKSTTDVDLGTTEIQISTHTLIRLSPESIVHLGLRSLDAAAAGFSIHRAALIVKA